MKLPFGKKAPAQNAIPYDYDGTRPRPFSDARAETDVPVLLNRQTFDEIRASLFPPNFFREAVACHQLLIGTGLSLRQAVKIGLNYRPKATDKTIEGVITRFLQNRESIRNLRPRTLDDYRGVLIRFCQNFGEMRVDDLSSAQIEKWLLEPRKGLKDEMQPWGPPRRNVIRGYLATLFNFAKKKSWATTNPAENVDRAIVDQKAIQIWTPEEARKLLNAAQVHCPEILGYLVLALFSGVRTCELLLMEVDAIKVEQGIIVVPACISKTRKLRRVPISENLRAWLSICAIPSGKIWPLGESSLHRRYRKLEEAAGLKWKNNASR